MFETANYGTMIVLKPLVPMTLAHAVPLQQNLERELTLPGIRDVVLDLAGVNEVDGSGLGAMVHCSTAARACGLSFYLYRPSEVVMDKLHELEISGFFPLLEHEEDLLAHMPD